MYSETSFAKTGAVVHALLHMDILAPPPKFTIIYTAYCFPPLLYTQSAARAHLRAAGFKVDT